MATYKGSLTLEWYNKQKSIILQDENSPHSPNDIPAPKINWVNKDQALFYEIDEKEGKGLRPFWVDRNDLRVKEARPLIFQKAFIAKKTGEKNGKPEYEIEESDTDDPAIENILIKGDNLLALNTLKKMFDKKPDEEKVKCIYIDPPYNTGSAFEEYDDNLGHSEWLTMMRDRLIILKELLKNDGIIAVQMDDSEGPYSKLLLDSIFGRDNHVITIYIQVRYNEKTLKEDMVFNKLIEQIHVYKKSDNFELKRNEEEYCYDKFVYKIIEKKESSKILQIGNKKVEIFRAGEYEIIKEEASVKNLKEIWASGSILDGNSSGRFFRDYLSNRVNLDGYKVLYKVYDIGDDGVGFRYFTGSKKQGANRGKYYQGVPTAKRNVGSTNVTLQLKMEKISRKLRWKKILKGALIMTRKNYSAEKKVAILKEHFEKQLSVADICEKFRIHPNQFYKWKKELFENAADIFAKKRGRQQKSPAIDLENKLKQRNEIIAELLQENLKLKNANGGR